MENPRREHWDEVKRVFRYFQGTSEYSIFYLSDVSRDQLSVNIQGYVDSDWAGDVDRRRSTSGSNGYVFQLFGGAISWMSKRKPLVSLFIVKAKYMVATHVSKEAIWLKKLCSKIRLSQRTSIIQCHSNNAICPTKNSTFHAKTKHIDVQNHFYLGHGRG